MDSVAAECLLNKGSAESVAREQDEEMTGVEDYKPGKSIRAAFPLFAQDMVNPPAYLDSAASTQKPSVVIERFRRYLSFEHANIHRGAYRLSANATRSYDAAREKVAAFIGASQPESVVFTGGTTFAINMVAYAFEDYFSEGDTILLSYLEHHSNIVPWQMLAERRRLNIEWCKVDPDASLNMDDYLRCLKEYKPRLVALTSVSNAFGSVVSVPQVVEEAHRAGAKVLIDVAQASAHMPLNLSEWGVDFAAFSAHKMYGPTGIGALYGRPELLEQMKPFLGGGDMIERVTTEGTTFAEAPRKFEAGTPPIAEAIAFGAAIDFLQAVDIKKIGEHEHRIFEIAFERFQSEPGVTVYGPATTGKDQASILSFNVDGIHPHDLATVADSKNVQLRAGHHCAMPAMKRLGLQSTARISLGVHSDEDDIDAVLEAIRHARKLFQ